VEATIVAVAIRDHLLHCATVLQAVERDGAVVEHAPTFHSPRH
jgi:hypothetical protein